MRCLNTVAVTSLIAGLSGHVSGEYLRQIKPSNAIDENVRENSQTLFSYTPLTVRKILSTQGGYRSLTTDAQSSGTSIKLSTDCDSSITVQVRFYDGALQDLTYPSVKSSSPVSLASKKPLQVLVVRAEQDGIDLYADKCASNESLQDEQYGMISGECWKYFYLKGERSNVEDTISCSGQVESDSYQGAVPSMSSWVSAPVGSPVREPATAQQTEISFAAASFRSFNAAAFAQC